jgi:hypothetical protein
MIMLDANEFNSSQPPHDAERIDSAHVFKIVETQSKYAPRLKTISKYYECANCAANVGDIPTTKTVTCDKCGLHMRHMGTCVAIWRDEPATAEA